MRYLLADTFRKSHVFFCNSCFTLGKFIGVRWATRWFWWRLYIFITAAASEWWSQVSQYMYDLHIKLWSYGMEKTKACKMLGLQRCAHKIIKNWQEIADTLNISTGMYWTYCAEVVGNAYDLLPHPSYCRDLAIVEKFLIPKVIAKTEPIWRLKKNRTLKMVFSTTN